MKSLFFLMLLSFFGASLQAREHEALHPTAKCVAYTQCFNGRVIACEVYANPHLGQSCSWRTIPYREVSCSGWDLFGNWVVLFDHC